MSTEIPAPDANVEDVRKFLRTADREAVDAVLAAERARPSKRATVIAAAGERLEKLDEVAETDPPSPIGPDGIPVLTDAETAAAPVTAQTDADGADTPPAPVEAADEAGARATDDDKAEPVKTVKPSKAAKVKPAQYDGDQWAVGQYAPEPVVRVLDKRANTYGPPRTGELKPGESGEFLVQAGDTITRHIRGILG